VPLPSGVANFNLRDLLSKLCSVLMVNMEMFLISLSNELALLATSCMCETACSLVVKFTEIFTVRFQENSVRQTDIAKVIDGFFISTFSVQLYDIHKESKPACCTMLPFCF